MARRIEDLHPDDYATRIELRGQLRALREQCGLSQRDLGKLLGLHQGNIGRMEREGVDQSKTSTVAGWARVLWRRLTLTPIGFPPPARWRRRTADMHPADRLLADLVETWNVGAFGGTDGWLAARTLYDLVGIRIACGVRQDQLGQVLGISEQSISLTERGTADNQLVTLQRYARGLARASRHKGGFLAVGLDPIEHHQPKQHPDPPVSV